MSRTPRALNRRVRLLLENLSAGGGEFRLDAAQSHHLLTVLRLEPGQHLQLLNGQGGYAQATLLEGGRQARLLVEELLIRPKPALSLSAWMPVIRPERLEVAVEKLTELGVGDIALYTSERTGNLRRPPELARLRRVAEAALEQSGNPWLPTLHEVRSLPELVAGGSPWCLAYPGGRAMTELPVHQGQLALLVGPEGGFSPVEEAALIQGATATVGLGPHILRAETAMLVLAGVAQSLATQLERTTI